MTYKKTVYPTGIKVITASIPHAQSVSLGIWVNAGSRDEPDDERGIFHLVEHMIFKGTKRRSALQIAKDLDAIGGFSNAFTSKEQTCFHARVLGKHLPFLTELFSDIFINSVFDEQDLELEKSVVFQEIHMTEDTPDEYVHILADESFWGGEPLGRPILGTRETVGEITQRKILECVSRFYSPERLIIAAAGNVAHEALIDYLSPLFESLPDGPDVPGAGRTPSITPTVLFYPKELEQVHICVGAEASSLSGENRFAEAILNTLLGGNMSSMLFQEVRENRGLAYAVYSYISAYIDTGLIRIYVATDKEKTSSVLELIASLIKRIQDGDLSSSDIERAKEYLIGGILLSAENTNSIMMRLAKNEFIFERDVSNEELIADVEKVRLQDVIEASARLFSEGRIALTALGPVDEGKITVDSLRFT
jgi:predicted Zn-dependent peptidase